MRVVPPREEIEAFMANGTFTYVLERLEEMESHALKGLEAAETERELFREQGRLSAFRRAIIELTSLMEIWRNQEMVNKRQE